MTGRPVDRTLELSLFGTRYRNGSGTYELMADLGSAAELPECLMLGGGNPARIEAMEAVFRRELHRLADDPGLFPRWAGAYSAPEGDLRFREAVAALLRKEYGWSIDSGNVALTPGSQAAFFLLFNMFAGPAAESKSRSIWLPLTPEYVGYADVGVTGPLLRGARAKVDELGDNLFKYRLDPAGLEIPVDAGAVCISRPTNPTGNVATDDEIRSLDAAARRAGVPLILDCAYGLPFPNIVFTDATPFWNENIVLCLSLSKLGLPGLRTGIVVARKEIISLLGATNAVTNLAPPGTGPVLLERLIRSGEVLRLAREVVRPHYEAQLGHALACARQAFRGIDWRAHVPEGGFFLWLRFPGLPIPNWELYARLKTRGVFVLSGQHFFPGGPHEESPHRRECIRVSYAQAADVVERGLAIIASEVRSLSTAHS